MVSSVVLDAVVKLKVSFGSLDLGLELLDKGEAVSIECVDNRFDCVISGLSQLVKFFSAFLADIVNHGLFLSSSLAVNFNLLADHFSNFFLGEHRFHDMLANDGIGIKQTDNQ